MSENAQDSIIRRIGRDDPSVYADIIRIYADDVMRLCFLILGHQQDAEEILQETLVKFVTLVREGKFRQQNGSIKGLLMTCAKNLCFNHLKKKLIILSFQDDETNLPSILKENWTPMRHLEEKGKQDLLEFAIMKLPDSQRIVLTLRELNGESYQEIAETLRITIENVRKTLYRARKNLRAILTPYRDQL